MRGDTSSVLAKEYGSALVCRLTSRWRRPGMQRDFLVNERGHGMGIPGRQGSPGASARGRWAAGDLNE
jgi:hypothetical protein